MEEQAIIIAFGYSLDNLEPFYNLSSKLRLLVNKSGFGEYDGHEMAIDRSDGFFFLYGPDAKVLYALVKETIEKTPFMEGAKVKLRLGPPEDGVEELNFNIVYR